MKSSVHESTFGTIKIGIAQNYIDNTNGNVKKNTENAMGKSSSRSSLLLRYQVRVILLLLAAVYGSLNISMRLVFSRPKPPTPSVSSVVQGWFTVICFLPLLLWNNNVKEGWRGIFTAFKRRCLPIESTLDGESISSNKKLTMWRFALELAFLASATQALMNTSLRVTQGARASFLVQTSVVFTPIISVTLGKQKVLKRVWIACFLALAGLFVLSVSGESEDTDTLASLKFTWGDWLCLLAAFCWSSYIYRLSAYGEYFDETMTQFVKNIGVALFYTIWMLTSLAFGSDADNSDSSNLWTGWQHDPIAWLILFYSALGPCTLADVLQQKAQSSVSAAESNIILSLEPTFTTLLGFLFLREMPSSKELFGGLLIMIASVIASCGS